MPMHTDKQPTYAQFMKARSKYASLLPPSPENDVRQQQLEKLVRQFCHDLQTLSPEPELRNRMLNRWVLAHRGMINDHNPEHPYSDAEIRKAFEAFRG